MPLLFALMIIIVPAQLKGAEYPIDPDGFPALADLAGFGLVSGVNPIGRLLEKKAHQGVSRLEDRRAHQPLQFLNLKPIGLLGFKANHQLLNFLVLG